MSELRIKTVVLGMVSTNCYFIYNEETRETILVDPAANGPLILNKCKEENLTPVAILLTHGHYDHIMAVEDLVRALRLPVYAAKEEEALLGDGGLNLSSMMRKAIVVTPDHTLSDGEEFTLAGFPIRAICTPGHTEGSICYYFKEEDMLISGDTLFLDSLGRTDLPTGDGRKIIRSIIDKLFVLPEDTIVYPGHGDPTTIAHELVHNPVAAYR